MSTEATTVNQEYIDRVAQYRVPDKTGGLISACSKNVVVFAELMLGVRLYAWQVEFLHELEDAVHNKDKLKIKEYAAITSRQIGKSTCLAVFGLWCTVFNKYPGTLGYNTTYLVISASDVQSKKLLSEVKKFIRIGDTFMKDTYTKDGKQMFGESFFSSLLDGSQPNNTTTISFKAHDKGIHGEILLAGSKVGSAIKSYPPTSSILGETATITAIDEVGKTDRVSDEFIYDYFYPVGNSTNAIRIYTSTPWVTSGFFYRIVNPENSFSESSVKVFKFTVEAIELENPDYYNRVLKTITELNADGKTSEVQRAYYCRFVKGEQCYFDPDKVMDVFTPSYNMFENSKLQCDMGIDFGGQVKSRTVITISCLRENKEIVRLYHKVYEVGADKNLIEDVAELMQRFNVQRIIPDDCPAGFFFINRMKEKGWTVQPMNFTRDKVKKYGGFRSKIIRGKVMSYLDDDLKTEMLAMEFSEGVRNTMIQHAPGYSDDMIDSFVMSCYFFVDEETGLKMWEL